MHHYNAFLFEKKECRVALLCKVDHWEPSEVHTAIPCRGLFWVQKVTPMPKRGLLT